MRALPFFIQKRVRSLFHAFLAGLIAAFWLCAPGFAADAPPAVQSSQLTAIDVSGNTVRISATAPVRHTVLATADPFKVVVDLEGLSAGSFAAPIRPEKSVVSEITVLPADGQRKSIQVVFALANPAQMKAAENGNALELTFEEIGQAKTSEPAAIAEAPSAQKAVSAGASTVPAAREITELLLEKTEQGAELVIKTDSRVKDPAVYDVEGNLYIDVPVSVMKGTIPSKMVAPVKAMKYRVERDRIRLIVEPSVLIESQVTVLDDELIVDIKPATAIRKKEIAGVIPQQLSPEVKKKTITLDFQDAEIGPILRLLGDVSGYNIVVHPKVAGRITMKLKDAPWDQALDIILKTFNLEKIVEGNVIRIVTADAYQAEKKALVDSRDIVGRAEEVTTKVFVVNNANLDKLRDAVDKGKILSPRGSISADPRTRSLIVKDIPIALEEVRKLVDYLDKPTPQVLIDARMVEVSTNFSRELGIEWGGGWLGDNQGFVVGSQSTTTPRGGWQFVEKIDPRTGQTIPGKFLSPGSPGTSGTGLAGDNMIVSLPTGGSPTGALTFGILRSYMALEARISALEATGKGKTVSNPKIMTVDNEQAVIKHGAQIPVTTRTQDGTFSTQYKDANLKLTVTPQISPDGTVYMKIEVTKDEPDFSRTDNLGNPTINSRQATTQLYVKDGETVVIGGIMKTKESDNEKAVPGLSKIPLLGLLFKNNAVASESEELLIFITPRIMKR